MGTDQFRWRLEGASEPQLTLFDEIPVRKVGKGAYRGLEFLEVRARKLINEIPAGFLPFRHTINAYRGCSHGCSYCFARPTHEYLGLGIGHDFDTKIVVKKNAPELVRAETEPSRWARQPIAMGTNTDPYQAAEGKYRLTRAIIEILAERSNPFSILTKSTLVLRDIDVLREAARRTDVRVDFSVGTMDQEVWRLTEPNTPHPAQRMSAVAKLNDAGVPSGVLIGPVLPGLSEDAGHLTAVVRAAVEAGARSIGVVPLHLKPGVREHYLGWLAEYRPDLVAVHKERFEGRSYQSSSQRAAISRALRRIVLREAPEDHPLRIGGRNARAPATATPRSRQKALFLD